MDKMNFYQLRNELSYCDDPVKELLIRKMMVREYTKLKHNKINKHKRYVRNNRSSDKITNNLTDNLTDNLADDLYNEIIKQNDMNPNIFDETDFNPIPNHGPLNDLDPNAKRFEGKYKEEIKRDSMNNNLMDRLNNDIDIQMNRVNKRKLFETPFSNENGGNFANIKEDLSIISPTDFSSRRFI